MKILVIGSGGREHALVWKIAQSPKVTKIYCAPGNPGTAQFAQNIPINAGQIRELGAFAKKEQIDLTFVGPEDPLINGVVDLFQKNNLAIIGPSAKAAQLEGSKIFAKRIMKKYGIPSAEFAVFRDYLKAKSYLQKQEYPLVIKADGVCLGKGVAVCSSESEALIFLKQLMVDKVRGEAGKRVVIEECLIGQEVSFTVATDGKNFVSFLPSQDHKRIYDGDQGPNTGGIGAYAPIPFVEKKLIERIEREIVRPTIYAMSNERIPYNGILYPGLILTDNGPKVLEFNCRFGDPETQPLMTLLKTDIIDIFQAITQKKVKSLNLKWNKGSALCVVLTSKGYPGDYEKGKEIKGLSNLQRKKDVFAFHAGTKKFEGNIISNGGRVLGITGLGPNLQSATQNTYKYIGPKGINFSGMHYRHDIGRKGLLI